MGHPNARENSKGKLNLGLVIESLHTLAARSLPHKTYSEDKTRESESAQLITEFRSDAQIFEDNENI